MSELTTELDRLIQKAALDGALTQKAVDMFHSVLKENEDLRDKCVKLEQTQKRMEGENKELTTQRNNMQQQILLNAEREGALEERETKITVLEMQAKYELVRVEDHKEMFTTVFRNSVLRKEVMTPLPGLKADQYGTSHSPYAQKDSVEEEEK